MPLSRCEVLGTCEDRQCRLLTMRAPVCVPPSTPIQDGLQRLLDGAVSLDILGGDKDGYFLGAAARSYLVPQSEFSLTGYITHRCAADPLAHPPSRGQPCSGKQQCELRGGGCSAQRVQQCQLPSSCCPILTPRPPF